MQMGFALSELNPECYLHFVEYWSLVLDIILSGWKVPVELRECIII